MLEGDPEKPLQNSLHRRHEQLLRWQQSDFSNEPTDFKVADKVAFPLGTQFLAACSSGDIEEAGRLLRKNVDVNTSNVDGLTALHQACIDNDLELVEFLIDHGCDVDVKDNEGWTPLHATSSCAYTEVAKFLLSKGADLAAVNNDGDLPVDLADNHEMEALLHDEMCRRGIDADRARRVEEQRMLKDSQRWLKTGRYIEVLDPKSGASPLHVAAAKGYHEVMKLLLQCPNVSVNARDYDGWTPLHAAAHWGQHRACELLIDNNADMDLCTNASQTIFEVSEPELVEVLKALKNTQQLRRRDTSSEISDSVPRKEVGAKRRSSVTRMSVDQKASVTSKIAEQEGILTIQSDLHTGSGGAGDSTGHKLPSPVNEETPDVRPWVKRRQEIEAASDLEFLSIGRKEKSDISPVEEESQDHEQKEKSLSPSTTKVEEKSDITEENKNVSKDVSRNETVTAPSLSNETGKENGVESPATGPSANQLNQRRISAVMAPMKGEESETQRSARARHARATRRSTQGVSQDELQEAKKLLQTDAPASQTQTSSPSTVSSSPINTEFSTAKLLSGNSQRSTDNRNGTSVTDQHLDANQKSSSNNSTADSAPVTGLPTVRSRRHQRRQASALSNIDDEPNESLQSLSSFSKPTSSTNISTSITSRSSVAPTTTTTNTTDTVSSIPSTRSPSRQLSEISATSTAFAGGRSSPPSAASARPRSVISSVGGNYGSSLTRTPTFHGTSTALPVSSDRQSDIAADNCRSTASSGTTGDDTDWKMRRRARRERPPIKGRPPSESAVEGSSESASIGSKTDSGRFSLHGDTTDNARQSSLHRPNSYHDSASPRPFSSRWGSTTSSISDSGPIDYKKLYEQERLESERLRKELDCVKKELTESRNDADRLRKQQGSSNVDTRRLERKLSEYEEEIKIIDQLKQENAKMKEENGALIRVISKLSK